MSLLVTSKYHIQVLAKYFVLCIKEPICCIHVYVLYFIVQDDDCACKFFQWLDTNICCMRGVATTPIVIAKFKQLEHVVEVANEELKQAHTLTDAAFERERVAKQMVERAKAARMISEEKAKKLTIALVVSWVMFVILLILSSRFGEVEIRQRCLP